MKKKRKKFTMTDEVQDEGRSDMKCNYFILCNSDDISMQIRIVTQSDASGPIACSFIYAFETHKTFIP